VIHSQQRATTILLSIIFSHINSKSYQNEGSASTIVNSAQVTTKTETLSNKVLEKHKPLQPKVKLIEEKTDRLYGKPAPVEVKFTKAPSIVVEVEKEDSIGKFMILKTFCQLFDMNENQISFYRNSFQPTVCRDLICDYIESKTVFKREKFTALLDEKRSECTVLIQQASIMEFYAFFDTFLPVLIHHGPLSGKFKGTQNIT
jgi:hypothetical protein